MSRMLAFATLAALAAGPAAAQVAWTAAPTMADMAAAYPEKAKAAGVGGAADLTCVVRRDGTLSDCAAAGETPRGYDFAAAALRLARQRLRAPSQAAGRELRIPIAFPEELARGAAPVVKTPKWAAIPTIGEIAAVTPKDTNGPNNARVVLLCDVQAGGTLAGCAVDREEPTGFGFGPAILSLAPKFKVELMSVEGMPTVGAKVRVPVRFDLTPVAKPAS